MKFPSDTMAKDYVDRLNRSYESTCKIVGERFNVSLLISLFPNEVFEIIPSYNGFLTEC
jgi:hypothetical protein